MRAEEILGHVGLQLLHSQGEPLVLGIDLEDQGFHLVALLQELAGVLDALGPGEIGDVHQAVDPLLHLDKGPEVRDVADGPRDAVAHPVLGVDHVPGLARLLEAQGQTPPLLIDLEHHAFHPIVLVEDLAGVLDALGPRHLGDVDQALDPLLHLHERTVVGEAHHFAADARARRVLGGGELPGILLQLLEPERHASRSRSN